MGRIVNNRILTGLKHVSIADLDHPRCQAPACTKYISDDRLWAGNDTHPTLYCSSACRDRTKALRRKLARPHHSPQEAI